MDNREKTWEELRALIGEVSVNLAVVEEGIDWILTDLLAQPRVRPFFRQHVLGQMMVRRKVGLLQDFVKRHGDLLVDAPSALEWLQRIDRACDLRNRLVHDLHEVSYVDGSITRRRLWQREGGEAVNVEDYRELASMTSLLTGPAFDALFESIFHVQSEDSEDEAELTDEY